MKGVKKKIRDNRYLNWILILSNWLFQSIINADKTEKIYRISFTIIFWVLFYYLLSLSINCIPLNFILSFILGHTLNWIVNGNFYNLIIHRLLLAKLSKHDLFDYTEGLKKRLTKKEWVLYAVSLGSICKGNLKDSSDVDISIVRKPGFKNAVSAIIFSVFEKKYADFHKIPLELYISDSPQNSMKRFSDEQNPVVIADPDNVISNYYQTKLTLEEAKKLNNLL